MLSFACVQVSSIDLWSGTARLCALDSMISLNGGWLKHYGNLNVITLNS